MKKVQGSLYFSLILMTWIPLIGFAAIMLGFVAKTLQNGMEEEVEEALRNLGISIMGAYEAAYPGDYTVNEDGYVMKGDCILYDDFSIIDHIKEETGAEVSLLYGNTRVLTTIRDREEQRINGTYVSDVVAKTVLEEGKEYFSKELSIYGKEYYGYYLPITNSDAHVVGMLFVGKQQNAVEEKVNKVINQVMLIGFIVLILAAVFSVCFSRNIINAIHKMMEFLRKVATGDLSVKQDEKLLARNDEIGEMGRLALTVQRSLRMLIERDGLTNLYNRRSGESRLKELEKEAQNSDMTFSVALGDIDYFKRFNDKYGHECGDVVLKQVSECFSRHFTSCKGYAIRWGGEEFLLVFMGFTKEAAFQETEKILEMIRNEKVIYGEKQVSVTMTFGVAGYRKGETIEKLVKRADDRLYRGKELGRNRIISN